MQIRRQLTQAFLSTSKSIAPLTRLPVQSSESEGTIFKRRAVSKVQRTQTHGSNEFKFAAISTNRAFKITDSHLKRDACFKLSNMCFNIARGRLDFTSTDIH